MAGENLRITEFKTTPKMWPNCEKGPFHAGWIDISLTLINFSEKLKAFYDLIIFVLELKDSNLLQFLVFRQGQTRTKISRPSSLKHLKKVKANFPSKDKAPSHESSHIKGLVLKSTCYKFSLSGCTKLKKIFQNRGKIYALWYDIHTSSILTESSCKLLWK